MGTSHPLHHVIVNRKTQPSGKTMRVILVDGGPFLPLIDYFGKGNMRNLSQSWQLKVASAVGLFLDYIIQLGGRYQSKGGGQTLFWDFINAIEGGTIGTDGVDHTGLFWPAHDPNKCKQVARAVKEFSDFCADKYGAERLVPDREATLPERITIYRQLDRKAQKSFFKHLETGKKIWEKTKITNDLAHSFDSSSEVTTSAEPPRFRVDDFPLLVTQSFVKYGGQKHSKPHLRYHLRDMMISILQGAAGFRASEPFHLFVDDIIENPRRPGHALVKLFHPTHGKYGYYDPLGGWVEDTRMNYLRSIGLVPRNLDGNKNYHAGWKNLALFRDPITREVYAPVTFFPLQWGAIFWDLYRHYMTYVRPTKVGHPFLFVTEHGKNEGEPYSMRQYVKKHDIAIKKLLGKPARKEDGTTTHGLRYMYARRIKEAVANLEDGLKFIQMCLRHRAIESQEVYTAPTSGEILTALEEASATVTLPTLIGWQK